MSKKRIKTNNSSNKSRKKARSRKPRDDEPVYAIWSVSFVKAAVQEILRRLQFSIGR